MFSKCLLDLIRTHDEVVVPGLGTFSSQMVPAGQQDDGTPIPPYRKVSYSPAEDGDDGTFLRFLAKYLPDGSDAGAEFTDFIEDFCGELDAKREIELEGIGTLKATAHKIYYFAGNPDFFDYPDVAGQESVSGMLPEDFADEDSKPIELSGEKWAREDSPAETAGTQAEESSTRPAVAGEKVQAQPATQAQSGQQVTAPEPAEEDDRPEEFEDRNPRNILIGNILLIVFVVLIFLMIAVTLLKDLPWMSNLLDHLLYTKEELEILGK